MYEIVDTCQVDRDLLQKIYLEVFGFRNNGFFVEAGAYDGKKFSNTYGLSKAGWSGLYIDPVIELLQECMNNHSFNNNIQYANCAVSNYDGIATLYIGDWASTICDEIMRNNPSLSIKNSRKIEVYKLDTLLKRFNVPIGFDMLVIDTEGNDLNVLESFSILEYIPKLVITEYTHETFDLFKEYFDKVKYTLISRDSCNLIFMRNYL